MPRNSVLLVERLPDEKQKVAEGLQRDFPYLSKHPEVFCQIVKWKDWYVGVPDDEVDPATYDSFSVAPLNELYSRTERFETGFLPVGMIAVDDVDFDLSVKTSGEPGLFLWRRDNPSKPLLLSTTFSVVLAKLLESPNNVGGILEELIAESEPSG